MRAHLSDEALPLRLQHASHELGSSLPDGATVFHQQPVQLPGLQGTWTLSAPHMQEAAPHTPPSTLLMCFALKPLVMRSRRLWVGPQQTIRARQPLLHHEWAMRPDEAWLQVRTCSWGISPAFTSRVTSWMPLTATASSLS